MPTVSPGADHARYVLGRILVPMLAKFDGATNLIVAIAEGRCPPLVMHVIAGRLTGEDEAALTRLRDGLDALGGRRRAVG